MTDAYWIAWAVLYLFGIALIALCVYPLRKHFYIAFFVGAMGAFWMLVPIPFDDEHWAPLFMTLTFQLFFDPEASYAVSATAATLGTIAIVIATAVLALLGSTYQHRSFFTRLRFKPKSKPRNETNTEGSASTIEQEEIGKSTETADVSPSR